jgi:hypothetical protein
MKPFPFHNNSDLQQHKAHKLLLLCRFCWQKILPTFSNPVYNSVIRPGVLIIMLPIAQVLQSLTPWLQVKARKEPAMRRPHAVPLL